MIETMTNNERRQLADLRLTLRQIADLAGAKGRSPTSDVIYDMAMAALNRAFSASPACPYCNIVNNHLVTCPEAPQ